MSGLLLLVAAAGCIDNKYKSTEPTNVFAVDPAYVGVDEGVPQQFTATLDGDPVAATWESSDITLATVNSTGLVTTIAPGFVAITATETANPTKKKSASLTIFQLFGTGLTSGVGVTVGGTTGQQFLFRIYVPPGKTNLDFTLSGGTGDMDIFVQQSNPPDNSGSGLHSWNSGNGENVAVANPGTGTWYCLVDVYAAGSGATLVATLTP
jgi:hypothetical protein